MTSFRKIRAYLLFATFLFFAAVEPANAKSGGTTPEDRIRWQVEKKARHLMEDLKKKGFEVSRGYFKLWDKDDCEYTYKIIGLCGNNPAAPYVTFSVPPWKEEFVDPAWASVWGPSKAGFNDVYRLDPREAIVILGQLPPPATYFSEQTFLFTRKGAFDEKSNRYQEISSRLQDFTEIFFKKMNDKRILSFSSLSNPNNNFVIEKQSGASFDQIRYFIITPDKVMDQNIRKALDGMAIRDNDVFTEPIPSDMKVGLDEDADDFTSIIRYAHPKDGGAPGTASDGWRKKPRLVVLRIRDKNLNRQPDSYPPVTLEARTAVDERPLTSDLNNLMAAVSRKWGQPCSNADCSDLAQNFIDLQSAPVFMVGPICMSYMQDCLGDNWDASYYIHPPVPIDDNEIYAVAGVLGTKSGNATYVSLSVNQIPMIKGVLDLSDKELDGTAKAFSTEVNNTDKFYLQYFSRNCSGLENLTHGQCTDLSMIPKGFRIAIGQRDYVKQGTQRGPDSTLVLPPKMMKLPRP